MPLLVEAGGQPAKLPWLVFALAAFGTGVLSAAAMQSFLLDVAFALLWTPVALCTWNAIRPWGGGMSLHDMQQKMKSMS